MFSEADPAGPPPLVETNSFKIGPVPAVVGSCLMLGLVLGFALEGWWIQQIQAATLQFTPLNYGDGTSAFEVLEPRFHLNARFTLSLFLALALLIPLGTHGWLLYLRDFGHRKIHWKGRHLGKIVGASILFFVAGVFFAYRVVLPLTFQFIFEHPGEMSLAELSTVSDITSYSFNFSLTFGILVELSLPFMAFLRSGALDYHSVDHRAPGFEFGILMIAGLITPQDAVSILLVGVPLVLLFEGCLAWERFTDPVLVERSRGYRVVRRRIELPPEPQVTRNLLWFIGGGAVLVNVLVAVTAWPTLNQLELSPSPPNLGLVTTLAVGWAVLFLVIPLWLQLSRGTLDYLTLRRARMPAWVSAGLAGAVISLGDDPFLLLQIAVSCLVGLEIAWAVVAGLCAEHVPLDQIALRAEMQASREAE